METVENRLRDLAARLLEAGEISLFLGVRRGALPLTGTPCFIAPSRAGGAPAAEELVYGPYAAPNLAAYLAAFFAPDPRLKEQPEKPVLGVALRSCELRSLYTLIREKQVPREKLVLVGLPCRGMIDVRRLGDTQRLSAAREAGEMLELEIAGAEPLSMDLETALPAACRECAQPEPPESAVDHLIDGPSRPGADGGAGAVRAFQEKPAVERWRFFREETAKCIRCYACRQACPTCTCRDCFAEQTDPRWIGASTDLTDTMIFHLVRVFHQAGRCSGCGACARACPMGVDLHTLNRKIVRDVEELFGRGADFSAEGSWTLSVFREDDDEGFLSEP